MKYLKGVLKKDQNISLPFCCPPWEVRVLEEKYPEGFVVTGSTEAGSRNFEADTEYSRMMNKLGRHPETGTPWVELVYGRASAGALADEIEEAMASDDSGQATSAVEPASVAKDERAEIIAKLDELGIEYKPSSKTPTLKRLLDAAQPAEDAA